LALLRKEEFLTEASVYKYYDVYGNEKTINLQPNCLGFTIAQVPVIYHKSDKNKIILKDTSQNEDTISGLTIDEKISDSIFNRKDDIRQIDVYLNFA